MGCGAWGVSGAKTAARGGGDHPGFPSAKKWLAPYAPKWGPKGGFLVELATWIKTTQLFFMTEVMSRVAFHESQEKNGRKSGIHFNLRKNR